LKRGEDISFDEYYELMHKKNPNYTKPQITKWYNQRAVHGADDVEYADPQDVQYFEKQFGQEVKSIRGPLHEMEEARMAGNWDEYLVQRKKHVRPLKRELRWDVDPANNSPRTIPAGQIPPPRFASMWGRNANSPSLERTTRRSCDKGRVGLPCDHMVGSGDCNGGVKVLRRVGDYY